MDLNWIRQLYQYNHWANQRIFDVVVALPLEQYLRNLKNSFPSVRDTLTHIVAAEWIWLERCRGVSPKSLPGPEQFADLAALRAAWLKLDGERAAFLHGLTPEQLSPPLHYVNTRGETYAYPLWQVLAHVVNHSTYHRGQITTLLRQMGAEPAATDLLLFYDEQPAGLAH
jgi:uncharacterized damage-inducible protein DinB